MEIGAHHRAEQEQRQRNGYGEFGHCIADFNPEITRQARQVPRRDEAEDEEYGFGDGRHVSGLGEASRACNRCKPSGPAGPAHFAMPDGKTECL